MTPLFEWCEKGKTVGVLSHNHTHLVLLAIRSIEYGAYLPFSPLTTIAQAFGISSLRSLSLEKNGRIRSLGELCDFVRSWEQCEGVVVHWQRPWSAKTSREMETSEELKGGQGEVEGEKEVQQQSDTEERQTTVDMMIKIKSEWYVSMAAASKLAGQNKSSFLYELLKARPTLSSVPLSCLFSFTIHPSLVDDVIPASVGILRSKGSKEDAILLNNFAADVQKRVAHLEREFCAWGKRIRENESGSEVKELRRQVIERGEKAGWSAQLLSAFIKGEESDLGRGRQMLYEKLLSLAHSNQISSLSGLLGFSLIDADETETTNPLSLIEFSPLSSSISQSLQDLPKPKLAPTEDSQAAEEPEVFEGMHFYILSNFPAKPFDQPPKGLKDHVLEKYIPKKIISYLGITLKDLSDETELQINGNYQHSEGKLKGMWEVFRKKGVIDLRVDLQPCRAKGFNEHYGDRFFVFFNFFISLKNNVKFHTTFI